MTGKIAAFAAAALMVLGGTAAAVPIPIVNFSFEEPALSPGSGQFTTAIPIPGWTVSGDTGVFAPLPIQMSQGPTQGQQVGYTNQDGLGLQQDLGAVLAANTIYTLQIDVQARTDFPNVGTTLELRTVNDDLLATGTQGPLLSSTNALLTVNFATGPVHPDLGEALRINILGVNPVSLQSQSDFDNVRLDASPQVAAVPEPDTLSLVGLGLLGFGRAAYRRLRRRG